MAKDCATIFSSSRLGPLKLRYFDPTMSAADVPEDKGLIECLMVKCAKALLYFAGDKDSFGKDAEAAMALSLGRPVVILCPQDEKGSNRMDVFKNVHPLSRLIHFDSGVACGAMVTQKVEEATELIWRIFRNEMQYDLVDAPYYRLRERLTGSVVRLQTSDKLIRETFWNYYHGEGRTFGDSHQ
jgi:hypothetical protein